MFDWENLRFFIAVAQSGSLSAAARRLKVDHATVSRRLSALETELKVRLIDRLPRACQTTAAGRHVLELAEKMEEHAFAIERFALAEHLPLQGTVTLSVPPVLAHNFFANHVYEFSQLHPGIRLAIASQAQSVSLGRREADIAIRLFRPEESQNVTRKLGEMAFGLYASREYAHAAQPADWAFIGYEAQYAEMPHQKWLQSIAQGRRIACEVSDITTQQAAARTGIGVAGLPVFMGDNDPALQRLPFDGEPFRREIWLAVHADLRHSAPIRAVIDFISDVIGATFEKTLTFNVT
ncbi:LysR family transcriptional regulator [Burkholderia ubonensis]|uniref:LysR family transcriptional regulator n=1 Tax=Burkholderia ubonensis TaxID=101571 RepID=A0A107G3A1_9BURK|nr:LysR family transcriptional regulator [Burkholderia ubonensis]AOK59140.1 LysR family transcriptional regulator [Burkholderia ubonensis]KWD70501.1 LysR family transcriptional regulator [Burkholderia ubonensis]KWD89104.1 LysR family transcriptional regulator [Burkholderia ubonensis]KWD95051.1 LysR family transcriptional regulator [Burkholderia ubonensis]KWE04478.1 LysR family transcriptional regulator [Burkholderia ubonensis]